MDKLDHKVFDPIYETCKYGEEYEDHDFQWHVWNQEREKWHKIYRAFDMRHETHAAMFLEAYRTGEIRDAGSMVSDWDVIREFENRYEWYKLDPAVFDELVDKSFGFWSKVAEENPRMYKSFPRTMDTKEAVELYKLGIIRQGGKMPEVCDKCGGEL